jgi:nucleoside 2-deoxyribosyltransferase
MQQCRICSFPCRSVRSSPGGGNIEIDCVRCGQYAITTEAEIFIEANRFTPNQVASSSGYIRQNPGFLILLRDLERLRNLQMPSVGEKAANLLVALGKEFPQPGTAIQIDCQRLSTDLSLTESVRAGDGEYANDSFPDVAREASKWMAVASACSPDELSYLLDDFLKAQGLIAERRTGVFVITSKGWQQITELRHTQSKSTKAFVAMSFAPELDEFFINAVEPGVQTAGYEALRIDRTEHNNRIDDEIIAAIRQTKFLIADFTNNRGGVYYEAGFAKGLGHEVIWSVREDHLGEVHFDTRQYNFLRWQMDDLPGFAKALQNRIEATVGKGPLTVV